MPAKLGISRNIDLGTNTYPSKSPILIYPLELTNSTFISCSLFYFLRLIVAIPAVWCYPRSGGWVIVGRCQQGNKRYPTFHTHTQYRGVRLKKHHFVLSYLPASQVFIMEGPTGSYSQTTSDHPEVQAQCTSEAQCYSYSSAVQSIALLLLPKQKCQILKPPSK